MSILPTHKRITSCPSTLPQLVDPPIPQQGISMSSDEQNYLLNTIDKPFQFKRLWKGKLGQFDIDQEFSLKSLFQKFKLYSNRTDLQFEVGGGTLTRLARGAFERVHDIDFFCTIPTHPDRLSHENSNAFMNLFLDAAEDTLSIKRDLFKIKDNEGNYLRDSFGLNENSCFVKIPAFDALGKITLDVRFDLKKPPDCTNSATCFRVNINDWIDGKKSPFFLTAASGYDPNYSRHLLKNFKVYIINPDLAKQLTGALKANEPTITNKGIIPANFEGERIHYEGWKKEYEQRGLEGFFDDLFKSLPNHAKEIPSFFASLTNHHSTFAAQSGGDASLLKQFDELSSQLLQKLHQKFLPNEEVPKYDAALLRTLSFWNYLSAARLKRVDCPYSIYQSRYFFPFRQGHLLALPPWKETLSLLALDSDAVQGRLTGMERSCELLGIPDNGANIRPFLAYAIGFIDEDPKRPLAPLFQWLANPSAPSDQMILPFLKACSHLDDEDLALIEKIIAKRGGMDWILPHISELQNHRSFFLFLSAFFKNSASIEPKVAQKTLRWACRREDLNDINKQALIEIGVLFPQYLEERSSGLFQKALWQSKEMLVHHAKQGLFFHQSLSSEQVDILLEIMPDVLNAENRSQWMEFWRKDKERFPYLFQCVFKSCKGDEKIQFLRTSAPHLSTEEIWKSLEELTGFPSDGSLTLNGAQIGEILHFLFNSHTDFETLEFMTQIVRDHPIEKSDQILKRMVRFGKELGVDLFYEQFSGLFNQAKSNRNKWIGFWMKECRKGGLPFEFLVQMIQSSEFNENEKKDLFVIILNQYMNLGQFDLFFSFLEKGSFAKVLSIPLIPILSKISAKTTNPEHRYFFLQALKELHLAGIDPKELFQSIPLHWLDHPRFAMQTWKSLEKIVQLPPLEFGVISREWQGEMLKFLLKSHSDLKIWNQVLEMVRNYPHPSREAILRRFVIFGRYLELDPLYEQFPLDGDFTHPIPLFLEAPAAMRELISTLLTPHFESVAKEWLPALLLDLEAVDLKTQDLEKFLNDPKLAPSFYQKCLEAALFRTDFTLPLLPLLQRMKNGNISPQISKGASIYLEQNRTIPLVELQKLTHFKAISRNSLWKAASRLRLPLDKLIEFSEQCLSDEKLPSLETRFKELLKDHLKSFQWWHLEKLHQLVHLSAGFKKALRNAMVLFLNQMDKPHIFLGPTYKIPGEIIHSALKIAIKKKSHPENIVDFLKRHISDMSHIPTDLAVEIFQEIDEKKLTESGKKNLDILKNSVPVDWIAPIVQSGLKNNRYDWALDFLMRSPDALQKMPLLKLAEMIAPFRAEFLTDRGPKSKFYDLINVISRRMFAEEDAKINMEILFGDFISNLPEMTTPIFMYLFNSNIEKLKKEPLEDFFKILKPVIKNTEKEERIGVPVVIESIMKKVEAHRHENPKLGLEIMAELLPIRIFGSVGLNDMDLFEALIQSGGPSVYFGKATHTIWERLNQELLFWNLPPDLMNDQIQRLSQHAYQFILHDQVLVNENILILAGKKEGLKKSEGVTFLLELTSLLTSRLRSSDKKSERNLSWKEFWLKLKETYIWQRKDLPTLIDLYMEAMPHATTGAGLSAFIALHHILLNVVILIAKNPPALVNERIEISKEFEALFHKLFQISQQFFARDDINNPIFQRKESSEDADMNGFRLLYLHQFIELSILEEMSKICPFRESVHMEFTFRLLDFCLQKPFPKESKSLFAVFKNCALISMNPTDLCRVIDRCKQCSLENPNQKSFFPEFLNWLLKDRLKIEVHPEIHLAVKTHAQKQGYLK